MGEELSEDTTPLGALLPGLDALGGAPVEPVVGRAVYARLVRGGDVSWRALAELSPRDVAQLPNVGPVRIKRLMSELAQRVGSRTTTPGELPARALGSATEDEARLVAAVREVASWAVGTGRQVSLLDALRLVAEPSAADAPLAELEWLATTPAASLAVDERVPTYDPVATAQRLISGFDERQRATLDRVLDFDGSAPTLVQLGEQFGVTRERIRQVESGVKRRIEAALGDPERRSLVAAADRLRERLGAAIPADELAGEFASYPPDLLDRLILHLAGPYRFDGDWYVFDGIAPFAPRVLATFDSVADGGVAEVDAVVDALGELGVRPEYASRAVATTPGLRVIEDRVLDWRGSLAHKSVVALQFTGRPMLLDELVEFLQATSRRSLSNQVHADERIAKVGVSRFALASWDMDTFAGLVPTMLELLAAGPRELSELADELHREFGVSRSSVSIMAGTHPAFLVEDGAVMLRPADRPYVPRTDLGATRHCYLVDGVWSWRVPVDRDVLRGSGRLLPEAFGVHLGLEPLSVGRIGSPTGSVGIWWRHQPGIGSLRAEAAAVGAEEGDWLFVRRVRPSEIDVVLLRAGDVPEDPDGRLRALVGAAGSTDDLERVLADALALRGSVNHDLAEERAALAARREHDLVELLDAVAGGSDR